jgi:hypothetical protein
MAGDHGAGIVRPGQMLGECLDGEVRLDWLTESVWITVSKHRCVAPSSSGEAGERNERKHNL